MVFLSFGRGRLLSSGRAHFPGQVLGCHCQREGWVLVGGQRQVVSVPDGLGGGKAVVSVVCSTGDLFKVKLLSSSGPGWYSGR